MKIVTREVPHEMPVLVFIAEEGEDIEDIKRRVAEEPWLKALRERGMKMEVQRPTPPTKLEAVKTVSPHARYIRPIYVALCEEVECKSHIARSR